MIPAEIEMGRQILFYMRPEDQTTFLRKVRASDPVVITLRDSDSADAGPAAETSTRNTLCLWNRRLLQRLGREWVPDPGYFRVNILKSLVLEFTPSFESTWKGKPALGQGRIFGHFEPNLGKPAEFENWYETLTRWIRKNYAKSPASFGGYVGPDAYEFYEHGGYLLPTFLPPASKDWLTEIDKQVRAGGSSR